MRQTEILKQSQYAPLPMEEQVVSIYAGTPQEGRESWLRGLELGDIARYEVELLEYMRAQHAETLASIRDSGKLEETVEQQLMAALDAFGKIFTSSRDGDQAA